MLTDKQGPWPTEVTSLRELSQAQSAPGVMEQGSAAYDVYNEVEECLGQDDRFLQPRLSSQPGQRPDGRGHMIDRQRSSHFARCGIYGPADEHHCH